MEKDNFFIKSQIDTTLHSVENMINTGVFTAQVLRTFQEPVFISIIIKLDDLLQKFRILNERVTFTDDIEKGDITDLVNRIRNAICHVGSEENMLDKKSKIKFVFTMIVGKGNAIQIGEEIQVKSDYEDDIAFFFGENRIYLKRHLIRLIKESDAIYLKLYPETHRRY